MKTFATFFAGALVCLVARGAFATSKGLNQIPTPDIQPEGVLSLSYQQVHPTVDNPQQLQFEYGISRRLEATYIHGFTPKDDRLGTEFALVQKTPFLLSTGFFNFASHSSPQPYLEAGFYKSHDQFTLGGLYANKEGEAILGYQHLFSPSLAVSTDYQSGKSNFFTLGFTVTRGNLVVNPALYFSNSSPRHTLGYVVFTYNFNLKRGGNDQSQSNPPSQNNGGSGQAVTPNP